MIEIHLSAEDLARTRFAFSALWETVASYRALKWPEKHPLHLPWILETQSAISHLDMSAVDALIMPSGGYVDFLTPPPTTPLPQLEKELAGLLETPDDIIKQDIINITADCPVTCPASPGQVFEPYLRDPKGALETLADTLHAYWEVAVEPHWPRLRTLLEADVLYRAQTFALNGPEKVLNELHLGLSYKDRTLQITKPTCHFDVVLSGRGLLLMPSVFIDHTIMFDPPWQETMQYGARGTAGLWCPEPPPTGEALAKLLGDTRARLLKHLLTPSTTTQLSHLFQVTPSAVSQNLSYLRETGLVSTRRAGKSVYYTLSPTGEQLLELYGEVAELLALAS